MGAVPRPSLRSEKGRETAHIPRRSEPASGQLPGLLGKRARFVITHLESLPRSPSPPRRLRATFRSSLKRSAPCLMLHITIIGESSQERVVELELGILGGDTRASVVGLVRSLATHKQPTIAWTVKRPIWRRYVLLPDMLACVSLQLSEKDSHLGPWMSWKLAGPSAAYTSLGTQVPEGRV